MKWILSKFIKNSTVTIILSENHSKYNIKRQNFRQAVANESE